MDTIHDKKPCFFGKKRNCKLYKYFNEYNEAYWLSDLSNLFLLHSHFLLSNFGKEGHTSVLAENVLQEP